MMRFILLMLCFLPGILSAAETAAVSPTGGILKMVLGLAVVLTVLALVAWLLKRMVPGIGSQHSVLRIVGGVSVGSRERVVVLEVGGRWLVVGVAPGQVSAIANLDIGSPQVQESVTGGNDAAGLHSQLNAPAFAQWLKQSASKFKH